MPPSLPYRLNLIGTILFCVGMMIWIVSPLSDYPEWVRPMVLVSVFGGIGLMIYAWWLKRRSHLNGGKSDASRT